MRSAALAAAASASHVEALQAPAGAVLRAASAAHVRIGADGGADAEAVALAAARAAAAASRLASSAAAGGGARAPPSRALPHPGMAAGVAEGARGVKRRRGEALGAPVALGSGERAPLLAGEKAAAPPRGWFDLPAPTLTTELKRELTILRHRNFLDPARRYKTSSEDRGALPKFFQIGTVVDGATDRRSSTRAQRQPTLVASLQADPVFNEYAARTMENIRHRAEGGGVAAYREKKRAAGAAWKKHVKEYKNAPGKKRAQKKLY